MKIKTNLSFVIIISVFLSLSVSAYAQSLQIISPSSGTIVHPGQEISVDVYSDQSVTISWVSGNGGLKTAKQGNLPNIFTLTVPSNINPGTYTISASGIDNGVQIFSDPVVIKVERIDSPSKIDIYPTELHFEKIGDTLPVEVSGVFSTDGRVYLTNSPEIKYTAENNSIASVSTDGVVTATGPGSTTVTATYKGVSALTQVQVPLGNATPVYKVVAAPDGTISKDASGRYFINIKITNNSNCPLANLTITSAILNQTTAELVAPKEIKTSIPSGESNSVGFVFPKTAGISKTTAVLQLKGTYSGLLPDWSTSKLGAMSFTFRVTLP